VDLGLRGEERLKVGDLAVEALDDREIDGDGLLDAGVGEAVEGTGTIGGLRQLLGEGWQVILTVDDLNVCQGLGTTSDEDVAAPQEVTGGPHGGRIGVGLREQVGSQQVSDLLGVDLIVLGLGAVDRLHVEGVAQDEGDAEFVAAVGEPVPGEHALAGDDEAVLERCEGIAEGIRVGVEVLDLGITVPSFS
jgi:hypothetical protein